MDIIYKCAQQVCLFLYQNKLSMCIAVAALGIFTIEVFLKLIDNFWMFWTSNWNIFDLIVTFFSVSCEIVKFASMVFTNP